MFQKHRHAHKHAAQCPAGLQADRRSLCHQSRASKSNLHTDEKVRYKEREGERKHMEQKIENVRDDLLGTISKPPDNVLYFHVAAESKQKTETVRLKKEQC